MLDKDEVLFSEGEAPRNVYVIHSGLVKLYRSLEHGIQATVRLVHPGELFGYTSLVAEEPYSLSAEAILISELCVFSAAAFFKTLEIDPSFARGLLKQTAQELRSTRRDLLLRAEHDATSKIASHLIELNGPGNVANPTSIRITRTALADLAGSAQETVSRVLGKLERSGLIERKGRNIVIRDKEGLRHLAAQRRAGEETGKK